MEENIRLLQQKFKSIKAKGYIKGVRTGPTGVGATFESLLGKNEDSFEIPDFYGIEIKTRRAYSKALITLFCAVPTGSSYNECKRLRDNYGYRDPLDHTLKQLNTVVGTTEKIKVGLWYYFRLQVDRQQERIILNIYNDQNTLIDNTTYWDFDILKEKLYRKLQIMALIKALTNRIDGCEYFNYYKMNIYTLKDFDSFINAFEKGKIKISLKIGSYHDQQKYGKVSNHGVGFSISEENLLHIFDIYR